MSTEAPLHESTIYGPVKSWRVGRSLGVDLIVERSTCSFNCVYCQLGSIQKVTAEQKIYIPTERVIADMETVNWDEVDIVTFSGSGEPTLATNIGEVIDHVRTRYGKRTMILTNATWLHDEATRARIAHADVISCKLDAADDTMLHRINRVVDGVSHQTIVEGIKALRAEFHGRLALQCMFMPLNVGQAEAIADIAAEIAPDEIQVNTPMRPYPKKWYLESRGNHSAGAPVETVTLKTISEEDADRIAELFRMRVPNAEIVSVYRKAPKS